MQIFYIKKDEFQNLFDRNFARQYADIDFKSEKRFYEHAIGRYLLKTVAKDCYNLNDTEIITLENGKPVFKNSKLCFSLSHSKNIITACFSDYPCGIDTEFMKNRDLEKLSLFFRKTFKTSEDFYKFWTLKEAEYKIDGTVSGSYCTVFEKQYMLTVVSGREIDSISVRNVLQKY